MTLMWVGAGAQQSLQTNISELIRHYTSASSYQMEFFVKATSSEGKVFSNESGFVKQSNGNMVIRYNDRITLLNEKCFLIIDSERRKLVYNVPNQQETFDFEFQIARQLQDLMNKDQLRFTRRKGGENTQIIRTQSEADPYFSYIDLELTNDNEELRRVTYHLKSGLDLPYVRLDVVYKNVVVGGSIPKSDFSEGQYVEVTRKSVRPRKAYQHFDFIDQTQYQFK